MGLHRLAMVFGTAAVLMASVACGDGGSGTASPTAVVSTPSAAATSTVVATATATAPAPAGIQPDTAAPSATTAPASTSAPAAQPTVAPPPTTPPPPPPPPAEQSLTIVAKDVKFVPRSPTAAAGAVLHLTLDNQDAGVEHDIVLYDASGAIVGATEPAMGPVRQVLVVTLGAPQRYTFKCSVHPQTMNGVLAVQ